MTIGLSSIFKYLYHFIPLLFIILGLTASIILFVHRKHSLYLFSSLGFCCFLGSSLLGLYLMDLPLHMSQSGLPLNNIGASIGSIAGIQTILISTGFFFITLGLVVSKNSCPKIDDRFQPKELKDTNNATDREKVQERVLPIHENNDKLIAGLVHLSFFLNILGIIISLGVYIMQSEKRSFVAVQAKQAIGYQAAIHILAFAFGLLITPSAIWRIFNSPVNFHINNYSIIILGLITTLVSFMLMGFAVYAAIQAFQGKEYRYPIIGNFIDRL